MAHYNKFQTLASTVDIGKLEAQKKDRMYKYKNSSSEVIFENDVCEIRFYHQNKSAVFSLKDSNYKDRFSPSNHLSMGEITEEEQHHLYNKLMKLMEA